ncbi:ribosome maturation factor RimM [Limosilactobacillus gastricus]|uniref:Ribosome maturation factor RimM n=1 Tax=Limosilactobacillus gastricus DSM 16045 TaxID=1423749 RepID=A0A0R1VHL7_9LACO|nr:ribosome maturation factor RimM [Limosilactobacillus gastricus]KRM03108.1 Ribosome maturation factor rimM [Limosilactobacillus gastricus DSM 16045]QGF40557.1 ribosome maturation factor RimM [Limosilactobacillus gastricus]
MTLYKVGKIVNTHGIRGEVKVITTTDFVDERFQVGNQLWIEQAGQAPIAVTIKQARPHKGTMLVKFAEFDNINEVEHFRNAQLSVTEADQAELEEGQYYYRQIIGLKVQTIDGRSLGTIKEILAPGANDVWVVQREGQSDLLLPVIDDVIKKVDLDAKQVTVELLEGLE